MKATELKTKIHQYRHLLLLGIIVIALAVLIASDPLGFCVRRTHDRAAIRNQMAIEKAETEQRIAIIRAQTEAEMKRIASGQTLPVESSEAAMEVLTDTPWEVER